MKIYILIFCLSLFLFSCGKDKSNKYTQVSFQFNSAVTRSETTPNIPLVKGWATSPSTISGFNCFLIMVSYASYTNSSCTSTSSTIIVNPNNVSGFFSLTSTISLSIPSGSQRTFSLFGSKSSSTCINYLDLTETSRATLSPLVLLGQTVADLTQSEQNIYLSARLLTTAPVIQSCSGSLFNATWGATATTTTTTTGIWDAVTSLWDQALWGN